VNVHPTSAQTRVLVANSHIHDNAVGVINRPGNNTITFTSVNLRNNIIAVNGCGAVTAAFGEGTLTGANCGTNALATINNTAVMGLYHNGIHDNGIGVLSRGANATAEIAYNEITSNFTFGLHRLDSGNIRTFTPATNVISNNAASDAPNQSVGLTRKAQRRRAVRR